MSKYTPAERLVIVELFIENHKSIISTQRAYRKKFPKEKAPTGPTIRALYAKLQSTGTLNDVSCPIKQRRARSNANITHAQELLSEHPNLSLRCRAQVLGISYSSMRTILRADLKLSPQKTQMMQQLKPEDNSKRLQYGKTMQNLQQTKDDFWNEIIVSSKDVFQMSLVINSCQCPRI